MIREKGKKENRVHLLGTKGVTPNQAAKLVIRYNVPSEIVIVSL